MQVEGRIDRAEEALRSYLELSGLESATIGGYQVERVGEELNLTPIALLGAAQLPLPDLPPVVHTALEVRPAPTSRSARVAEAPSRYSDTAHLSQVSFLAPEEAAFMHELRQLAARAATIYDSTRPDGASPEPGIPLMSAAAVYAYLRGDMTHLPQEQMRILTMNLKNRLIAEHLLYQGTLNATTVRVAEVFRPAIVDHAASIIIAHNHPSGDPTPSADDIAITRQLTQAGDLFDITLLDHVIVARGGYASLKERGHISVRPA